MNSFDQTYKKIIRSLHKDNQIFYQNKKITIGDVICESVLPSPYMLINDIVQNLKNNILQFKYNKDDLKRLSDKDWKYFSLINKLPELFSLTIIKCSQYQFFQKFNIKPSTHVTMEEIVNPNNQFDQHIFINSWDSNNDVIDDGFKNLLKHQLGHVWTFIFGTLDDDFKDGQGPWNQKKQMLNQEKFTQYQKDVFIHLYNKNLKALTFDYNYVLCKSDETETANYEISTNIDNIIEILIADYFDSDNGNTETYLNSVWNKLNLNYEASLESLHLLKVYKENMLFKGYESVQSIKNPIRRLFLIFAFGNKKQIEYFKEQCEKEFGKIKENKK